MKSAKWKGKNVVIEEKRRYVWEIIALILEMFYLFTSTVLQYMSWSVFFMTRFRYNLTQFSLEFFVFFF